MIPSETEPMPIRRSIDKYLEEAFEEIDAILNSVEMDLFMHIEKGDKDISWCQDGYDYGHEASKPEILKARRRFLYWWNKRFNETTKQRENRIYKDHELFRKLRDIDD